MQAQQNQTDQQDAGPAGSRLLALGFRQAQQAAGSWLLASGSWQKETRPGNRERIYLRLKVTQKVGRKLHTKVTYESYIGFWTKVTYESYIRKLEMKVTYNSSYFTPICP